MTRRYRKSHVSQLSSMIYRDEITEIVVVPARFLFLPVCPLHTCRIRITIQNNSLLAIKILQCPLQKWLLLFQLLQIRLQPCPTTLNTRHLHQSISLLAPVHHQLYQHPPAHKQFSLLHHGPILQQHQLCEHHLVVEAVKTRGTV